MNVVCRSRQCVRWMKKKCMPNSREECGNIGNECSVPMRNNINTLRTAVFQERCHVCGCNICHCEHFDNSSRTLSVEGIYAFYTCDVLMVLWPNSCCSLHHAIFNTLKMWHFLPNFTHFYSCFPSIHHSFQHWHLGCVHYLSESYLKHEPRVSVAWQFHNIRFQHNMRNEYIVIECSIAKIAMRIVHMSQTRPLH